MDGKITCLPVVRRALMLALQQCLPVQLEQHRLPVTLDRAAAARMLQLPASCGLQNHIKASMSRSKIDPHIILHIILHIVHIYAI